MRQIVLSLKRLYESNKIDVLTIERLFKQSTINEEEKKFILQK